MMMMMMTPSFDPGVAPADPFARVLPEWGHGRGPLVVKLGGAALDEPARVAWLWTALAELHEASPGGLVLVHGGAAAVDRHLGRLGMTSERRDGIRITPPEQIDAITGVLAGSTNKALVGALAAAGAPAVGLCLGDGGTCRARRTTRFDFDAGCVGEIVGGDGRLVRTLLKSRFLPVLCSIALDESGAPLNINADEAAAGVAALVSASALLLLTDVGGVLDREGRVIETLDAPTIERLIADGTIHGGMIPKVRGALEAAEAARAPAIIAAWNAPETFATLARGERAGTHVLPAELVAPVTAEASSPSSSPSLPPASAADGRAPIHPAPTPVSA